MKDAQTQRRYVTIEEIANKHGLKPSLTGEGGTLEYVGHNPYDPGAQHDGFALSAAGHWKGSAVQRTPKRFYPAWKIAELEQIRYEDYEGFESHPKETPGGYENTGALGGAKMPEGKYDTRTLEERGLSAEAREHFRISGPLNPRSKWGEHRFYPTFHPDGAEGRGRRKWRFPQLQREADPNRKPAKVTWDNKSANLGIPIAYGLNYIQPLDVVWLVNSELAVWLFHQEQEIRAICPLGESRKAEVYQKMIAEVVGKGGVEVRILLDNDTAGRAGALDALRACQATKTPCRVYDLSTAKVGFDAADLWELWNNVHRESLTFLELLESQAIASSETLLTWARMNERAQGKKEVAQSAQNLNELGVVAQHQKGGSQKRKCPKCQKFAVIADTKTDEGGWLCWKKLNGCGAHFSEGDEAIESAKIKAAATDPSLELLDMLSVNQLFHTDDGGRCIVIESSSGRKTTYEIHSAEFAEWVRYTWHVATGKVAKPEQVKQALDTLASYARWTGPELKSNVRTASHDGNYYIDLADDVGRVVKITRDGWEVLLDCPVFFRRPATILPLPVPERDPRGNEAAWENFKALLNYGTEENWTLIMAWMVSALVPGLWSCPFLSVHGEHGSAKSFLSKLCKRTIDPHKTMVVQNLPEPRELVISLQKCRVFAMDNQQDMPKWLSDLLCSCITGNATPMRKLFTDSEQVIFDAQPALILNGIQERIGGQDLADRALKLFIPRIKPKDGADGTQGGYVKERSIYTAHDKLRPFLLGAIFDAMSAGLRNEETAEAKWGHLNFSRMADFCGWVMCCAEAMPFDAMDFFNVYTGNRAENASADLEKFFPQVVIRFVEEQGGGWQGTAQALYEALKVTAAEMVCDQAELTSLRNNPHIRADDLKRAEANLLQKAEFALERMKKWPQEASTAAQWLTQAAPSLRKAASINAERGKRKAGGQMWHLEKIGSPSDPPSEPAEDDEYDPFADPV